MKKTPAILFFAFLIFIACNSKNSGTKKIYDNNRRLVKGEYNKAHVLVYEQEFKETDTGLLADGYCKYYDDSGTIRQSFEYREGKVTGLSCDYYENGRPREAGHVINGIMNGTDRLYYRNGNIEHYILGTKKKVSFAVSYDSTGNVEEIIGHPLLAFILNEKPSYSTSDTPVIINWVAIPDKVKDTVTITLLDKDNKPHIAEIYRFAYSDTFDRYYFMIPLAGRLGIHAYKAKLKLYDSLTNKLIAVDTFACELTLR